MDNHSDVHAVLAELRLSAERAEAALQQVQLRRDPRVMPPPGMLATLCLASMPVTIVKRLAVGHRMQ
ncbi:hypothetical protein [Breoghania sp.]|uniref:hypothetical protein n=1 Tax=Breoghania sp. TaxID=2065378 RepID=UPI002AABB53E|nr:hypothetical protein [Breoghania sp.]